MACGGHVHREGKAASWRGIVRLDARWLPYLMLVGALGCGRCGYEPLVPRDGVALDAGQADGPGDASTDGAGADSGEPDEFGGSCEYDGVELDWECGCDSEACRFVCPDDQPECDTDCTGNAVCEQVCPPGASCRLDCYDDASCRLYCATETCVPGPPCTAGARCRLECVDDSCSVSL